MRSILLLLTALAPLQAAIVEDVPEPSTYMLMGGGLAAMLYFARKRRK